MSESSGVLKDIDHWATSLPGRIAGKCGINVEVRSSGVLVRAAWKRCCTPTTASIEIWFGGDGDIFKAVVYGTGQNTVSFGIAVLEDALLRLPQVTCGGWYGWQGRAIESWWSIGDSRHGACFAEGQTYTFNFKEES